MGTVQKGVVIAGGLAALFLVVSNPKGVAAAAVAGQRLVGGTFTQIATGGKSR